MFEENLRTSDYEERPVNGCTKKKRKEWGKMFQRKGSEVRRKEFEFL